MICIVLGSDQSEALFSWISASWLVSRLVFRLASPLASLWMRYCLSMWWRVQAPRPPLRLAYRKILDVSVVACWTWSSSQSASCPELKRYSHMSCRWHTTREMRPWHNRENLKREHRVLIGQALLRPSVWPTKGLCLCPDKGRTPPLRQVLRHKQMKTRAV